MCQHSSGRLSLSSHFHKPPCFIFFCDLDNVSFNLSGTESDVDVCVVMTDVFWGDFTEAPGENLESYGFLPSNRMYEDDRELVRRALVQKFGSSGFTSGKKAFDVHGVAGSRVDADVVPAWLFRSFHGRGIYGQPIAREGIAFWTTDGKQVINVPEQHIIMGRQKTTQPTTALLITA
ncbi:hypothetical protein [Deinococcus proteolyticus]|uniref:hypothetical protein n=1 Tax=Deinococcus proteolyticus TaxID=55148 RepID=UPI00145D8920|nr:hypothetical protein [Deinococcus proteolyticus]